MILTRRSLLQLLGISSAAIALPNLDERGESAEPDDSELLASRRRLLENLLVSRGIKPAHLARESGYSRQHLLRLRFGRMRPSLACIAAIVAGVRRLTRERVVPEQLFEEDVIRAAWRDAYPTKFEQHERAELRATFGRRTLREFLGGQS